MSIIMSVLSTATTWKICGDLKFVKVSNTKYWSHILEADSVEHLLVLLQSPELVIPLLYIVLEHLWVFLHRGHINKTVT